MNAYTRTICIAALEADPTVSSQQIAEVLTARSKGPANKEVLLVNQTEAARMLGVSRFTIRRLVQDGVIEPVRIKGLVRYRGELQEVGKYIKVFQMIPKR
jgi:excisionase family DNA binding protein